MANAMLLALLCELAEASHYRSRNRYFTCQFMDTWRKFYRQPICNGCYGDQQET